jgi:PDDEXK-like domain of unknown function (DUF3799)
MSKVKHPQNNSPLLSLEPSSKVPEPDYYNLPNTFVSQSSLKQFIKSPQSYHWQYVLGNDGWAGSAASNLGSLVHCMLLEPHLVEQQYYLHDEAYRPEPDKTMASNANKQWKATMCAYAVAAGQQLVTKELYSQADAMLQKLCEHELAMHYFITGLGLDSVHLKEQAVFWRNDCSDLPLKSKLDILLIDLAAGKAWVVDYKTTSACNSQEFGWSVKKYGYDIQAAFYQDAARSYLQDNYPGITFDIQVLFIPQNTKAPYQVLGVYELDADTLRKARATYERALQELEGCLHTGIWEQSNGIELLQLSKPLEGVFLPDTELIM